jgi:hypothetical protein
MLGLDDALAFAHGPTPVLARPVRGCEDHAEPPSIQAERAALQKKPNEPKLRRNPGESEIMAGQISRFRATFPNMAPAANPG